MEKKKVLIVDSQPNYVVGLKKGLIEAGYEISLAEDGDKALELTKRWQPDIILSEVTLPHLDGYHFFEALKSEPITRMIPFIFISEQKKVDDRIKSISLGVDDYIIKPYYVDEVIARVEMVLKEREQAHSHRKRSAGGFSGNLSEMNLVDLIQTLELGRKSGVLKLTRDGKQGHVYIQEGEVIDATLDNFSPEQALLKMFTWTEGNFKVEMTPPERPKTISLSNKEILSQGIRIVSQWEHLRIYLPPLYSVLSIKPDMTTSDLTDEEKALLELVHGNKRILDLLEESQFEDIKTLEIIKNLYTRGFLHETVFNSKPRPSEYLSKLKKISLGPKPRGEKILSLLSTLFKKSDSAGISRKVPFERRRFNRRKLEDRRKMDRRTNAPGKIKNEIHLTKSELMMIREKLI